MTPRKTDGYTLQKQNNQWLLTVLCGGFAMFERTLILSKEKENYIEEWGDYGIEKLALDIAKEPVLFGNRLRG